MKKIILVHLILLISIYSVNAQKTINLNSAAPLHYKEIDISKDADQIFNKAERARQIVLNNNIQTDNQVQLHDIIELELFNDKQYKSTVDKVHTDVNGTLMVRAKLIGFEHAYCFISTFEGKTFLTVEVPENNELFMTKYIHATDTYYLMQTDNEKMIELAEAEEDGVHLDHHTIINSISKNPIVLGSPTTLDTVTLMLVYTPAAAAWSAANEVNINNTISLLMAKADLANTNSNTLLDIQLVHSQQVAYTELQSGQDLANLRDMNDGNMDNVHTLRDNYCADLVSLLEETSHTGGSAYLLTNPAGSPTFGFSIIRVQQASWTYTGIHEFGHNLGCSHHKDQNFQAGPGIFSYSAGGRWTSVPSGDYCSIMSYEGGSYFADGITHTRVPHFSNPVILYQGTSTGDSTDADNARSIRNTKTAVSAYRSNCTIPSATAVSGAGGTYCDSAVLTASGGMGGTMYYQGMTSGGTSFLTPSNSMTVYTSGTYYFRAHNFLGWGPEGSETIVIDSIPSQAGIISGPISVCQGQTSVTYTVPPIVNTISYIWTLPSGAIDTITTNSITIDYSNTAISGNITVMGNNLCGDGQMSSLAVVVDPLPAIAGPISGPTLVCPNQLGVLYTVPVIANATSYVWTLPNGVSGTSTTNTITIDYSDSASAGSITVMGTNSCGDGVFTNLPILVDPLPDSAGVISGLTTLCQGQQSEVYTVPTITHATSYVWTLPTGVTGTSTTNSITVSFSNNAISGNISVKGNNACGDGPSSSLPVIVNPTPSTPIITSVGNILQSNAPSGNQWYNQNGILSGETNSSLVATVDGDYYVIVTLLGCSSEPSNSIFVSFAGIETMGSNEDITIFPNPVSTQLIVEIERNEENVKIDIFNAAGQIVYSDYLVAKKTIDTKDFATGTYLIKLESESIFEIRKMIKE
ncbi:MAG: T9SS type A sorting domain-containing protein [Crocinitomicaceae bacterium]